MNTNWLLVNTPEAAKRAAEHLRQASILGIDTEYDSFRYFREKLCLIQIYAKPTTYVIDAMAQLDLSFLARPLKSKSVVKILHAADNDIRLLKRDYGFEFKNIFDTHRAASILGCHYLSLSALINQYLGIELKKDKKTQRSKWETRPLTQEQIHYAVEDTAYLKDLYYRLEYEIARCGFDKKAAKSFENIAAVTWSEKSFNPQGYINLKGYQSLTANQKQYLMNLYRWRFQKAQETNMARFRILSDQNMVELAKTEACSMEMLKITGILSSEKVSLYGQEIIDAVRTGVVTE